MSLTLEMRGIAPRSSGLISGRSTIWPSSHVYQISRNFFSLSQQLWSFSFRLQKISLLAISTCNRLSEDNDNHLMSDSRFVDAGHWSPYLSHAKRALYYLSYMPMIYKSRKLLFQSANKRLKFFLKGISCMKLQYSVVFWRKLINCSMSLTSEMRGIAPRTSGWLNRRSTIWPTSHVYQISRNFFSLSQQLWSFSFRSQKVGIICK